MFRNLQDMSDRVALGERHRGSRWHRARQGPARSPSVIFSTAIHDNVAVDVLASGTALRADIQALRHDLQSSDAPLDGEDHRRERRILALAERRSC